MLTGIEKRYGKRIDIRGMEFRNWTDTEGLKKDELLIIIRGTSHEFSVADAVDPHQIQWYDLIAWARVSDIKPHHLEKIKELLHPYSRQSLKKYGY